MAIAYMPEHLRLAPTLFRKPTRMVVGRVALWGEIEEGEKAYRAEYAKPVELFVPHVTKVGHLYAADVRDALSSIYDVPARLVRALDEIELAEAAA
jgi:hypothetical protein